MEIQVEVVIVCVLEVEYEFTKASFSSLFLTLCSNPSQIPSYLYIIFFSNLILSFTLSYLPSLHSTLNPNTLTNKSHFHS